MAAEWLSADQVAAMAATELPDDQSYREWLRTMLHAPNDLALALEEGRKRVRALVAQDGRWRDHCAAVEMVRDFNWHGWRDEAVAHEQHAIALEDVIVARDAEIGRWRALVGAIIEEAEGSYFGGWSKTLRQAQAALDGAETERLPSYTNHAPGCPMRTSGGILPGCSCGALTREPPAPRGAAE